MESALRVGRTFMGVFGRDYGRTKKRSKPNGESGRHHQRIADDRDAQDDVEHHRQRL